MGSLVETMKIMEDNSYNENEYLSMQKYKKAKNSSNEVKNLKNIKDLNKNKIKEEKSNREKYQELMNLNIFSENKNIYLRQASPLFNNYAKEKDSKKKSIEKIENQKYNKEKDPFGMEPFSENMKKLISKKKK